MDTPLHIAIIPDGNRRWAKNQSLDPWEGHRKAINIFRSITEWCRVDPRVSILTIWCFSTENWKRDEKEIGMLMDMLEQYLNDERASFAENNIRFLHSGRKDRIPSSLAILIEEIESETKDNAKATIHLALDYGGKDELLRAMSKLTTHNSQLTTNMQFTDEEVQKHLDQPNLPNLDLIIRTSGEHRTSNFFLWQSAYSEWDFVDKFFPDFTTEDLDTAVSAFAKRTRRFGG